MNIISKYKLILKNHGAIFGRPYREYINWKLNILCNSIIWGMLLGSIMWYKLYYDIRTTSISLNQTTSYNETLFSQSL